MSSIPVAAGKAIGLLTLVVGLLVLGRELGGAALVDGFLFVPVTALVLVLSRYVSPARRAFVATAAVVSVGNLWWDPAWPATLTAGIATAAFIAAFFSALTTLKFAAETSPAILDCGRFLAHQPPARRYLALTVGGQLFGLLLNYGAISLLGSMSLSTMATETNAEIRRHRTRRMLLAIQRGFISILPWSPLSFAAAISTALVPDTSWAQIAAPGLVSGGILVFTGWLLDRGVKPKSSTPSPPRGPIEGNWFSILPLVFLLLLLVLLLGAAYWLTGLRILALVMLVVPLLSLLWMAVQGDRRRRTATVAHRAADFLLVQLAGFRNEMVLLMMAGYLGTVASPLLGSIMAALQLDFTVLPAWVVLVLIVWIVPFVGQLGMNPILAVALIAPLLPAAPVLGVSPVAVVVALTAGWILSGVSSPFTATTMLVGNFAGISSAQVGRGWNGAYTILCGILLSGWVVGYARWG